MLMCRNIKTLFNFDPPATEGRGSSGIAPVRSQDQRLQQGRRRPTRRRSTPLSNLSRHDCPGTAQLVDHQSRASEPRRSRRRRRVSEQQSGSGLRSGPPRPDDRDRWIARLRTRQLGRPRAPGPLPGTNPARPPTFTGRRQVGTKNFRTLSTSASAEASFGD